MNEKPRIYMLTGAVQTGKTRSLTNWAANRTDVYGILTPVVDGRRFFMNAHTKEQFPMEAVAGEQETLTVGRFIFSKTNFEKAITIIRESNVAKGWLVIDEIGPLELRGEGFAEVLKEVIATHRGKFLLVVREGLAGAVSRYFNIQPEILTITDLVGENNRR
jgi:nucleoside-triphosphatase THEP1